MSFFGEFLEVQVDPKGTQKKAQAQDLQLPYDRGLPTSVLSVHVHQALPKEGQCFTCEPWFKLHLKRKVGLKARSKLAPI